MEHMLLAIIIGAIAAILIGYFILKLKHNKELAKYKADVDAKLGEHTSLETELSQLKESLTSLKSDLYNDTKELEQVRIETEELRALKSDEAQLLERIREATEQNNKQNEEKDRLSLEITKLNVDVKNLMGMLDLYSRLDEFTSVGHFENPEYLYETSARFSEEIKYIRSQQKDLIRDKNAITYPVTRASA